MSSDNLTSGPLVRPVRIGATVSGKNLGLSLLSLKTTQVNFFTADTWSAEFAMSLLPAGLALPFWSSQTGIEIEFQANLKDGDAPSLVAAGIVDEIRADIPTGVLSVSGRDYTAGLIDSLSNDKLTNQTSSQIATTFAQRRGLTPQVTTTSTPVGRFLNGQTDYMAEDISEWRVLSFLAQQEGFDVYTQGKTLVFGPALADPSPLLVSYHPESPGNAARSVNAKTLELKHRKPLAGPVTVQVRSWQYQTKSAILSTYTSKKKTPSAASNGVSIPVTSSASAPTRAQKISGTSAASSENGLFYIERRAGLTQQQADQLAQKKLADITSHEREVSYSAPGILGIDPRRTFRLSGTGSAFDQDYQIKSIDRQFTWRGGCSMDICAKSSSAAEQIRL